MGRNASRMRFLPTALHFHAKCLGWRGFHWERFMNRTIVLCAAVSLLALAGCSKPDPNKRLAGMWSTKATIDKLELTGVPAGAERQVEAMKGAMRSQMETQFSRQECLTAEAAKSEDITQGFLQGVGSRGDCNFPTRKVGDGKIELAGTCSMGPNKMDIAMNGTTSPEKIDLVMTMKGGGATGGPKLDLATRIVATRTGDCAS